MWSYLSKSRFCKRKDRILITGTDEIGKTTILYNIKPDGDNIIPAIGYLLNMINYANYEMISYEIRGSTQPNALFSKQLYESVRAIVFVVDCAAKSNLENSKKDLDHLLEQPDLQYAKVLIIAKNTNLSSAASLGNVITCLEMNKIKQNCHIQEFGLKGKGLRKGFHWLNLANK